jgi:hypothetical protein
MLFGPANWCLDQGCSNTPTEIPCIRVIRICKTLDRPTDVKTCMTPNRTRDSQATIKYTIYTGRAAPGWPAIGGSMRKDQAVTMQLGNIYVTVPRAKSGNFQCLQQKHLDSVASGRQRISTLPRSSLRMGDTSIEPPSGDVGVMIFMTDAWCWSVTHERNVMLILVFSCISIYKNHW